MYRVEYWSYKADRYLIAGECDARNKAEELATLVMGQGHQGVHVVELSRVPLVQMPAREEFSMAG